MCVLGLYITQHIVYLFKKHFVLIFIFSLWVTVKKTIKIALKSF